MNERFGGRTVLGTYEAIKMRTYQQDERADPAPSSRTMNNPDRQKDHLLPIIAHELRQPLSAVLMAIESMHDELSDESASREACDTAKRAARQMSRMIDDMLDVYRDVHGRLCLRLAPVELATIVYNAIAASQPSVAKRGHRISVSLPPEPLSFVADSSRLEQIFTNLLTNAAKYTEPGGLIYLTADALTEAVVVRVGDNGRGISPERLPAIFEPFQPRVNSDDGGGLGLGLALVKSLVELHGGNIAAHSRGSGMGSEFVVRLPLRGPDIGIPALPFSLGMQGQAAAQ